MRTGQSHLIPLRALPKAMPNRQSPPIPWTRPPLQTILVSRGPTATAIVRRWLSAQARRCNLCTVCTALHAPDGQALCCVVVDGPVDPSTAPAFSDHS